MFYTGVNKTYIGKQTKKKEEEKTRHLTRTLTILEEEEDEQRNFPVIETLLKFY